MAELERSGREAVAAIKATAGAAGAAGVECEEILASGRPHRVMIQVADEIDADLIIVGSTGMTSLERALMGSESEALMRLSKRPVLLVREP